MKITDIIKIDSVSLGQKAGSKSEIICKLADLLDKSGTLLDKSQFVKDVEARESTGTTGIGGGIAIPHAKSSGVAKPAIAAMTVPDGTNYESLDGEDTKLFFSIAVPQSSNDEHLKVLSRLSTMLMDNGFVDDLLKAQTKEDFIKVIEEKEKVEFPEKYSEIEDKVSTLEDGLYDILAVTGCPTGIAHTYMAEKAIKDKASEKGLTVKVETHGSRGVENHLSQKEIDTAKGIIVASDVSIDLDRFDGKRVINTKVANGINKPEELIDKVLTDAPIYKATGEKAASFAESDESPNILSSFYKHLMNGVSHMLPFVIGGGILIAISFLLDDYTINPAGFGSNTKVAAFFNQIGGGAFGFMLPILAGFIGMSIADRPGFTVGMVGGYLAGTGGAGFLGALVAGFLSGAIIKLLKKATDGFPKSMDGIKPILIYPVFGILSMGALMIFVLNPPFTAINTAITNWLNGLGGSSAVVLGLLLGGMMAVDMGGPVNKAAYVFGTASLASGSSTIMAAVMAGGMVPPLAIAISMLIFKDKFTKEEKQTIPTNIIMGLSFITEGAIPFAAADPLRTLPPMVLGSGVAGALSMVFGSSLMAPHGGLWVIGVIENPLGYIVAISVGTLLGAILFGLLRRNDK